MRRMMKALSLMVHMHEDVEMCADRPRDACLSSGNRTVASGRVLVDASRSFNSPAATAAPVSLFALLGLAIAGRLL